MGVAGVNNLSQALEVLANECNKSSCIDLRFMIDSALVSGCYIRVG